MNKNILNICVNFNAWDLEKDFRKWHDMLPRVLDRTIETMNLKNCEVNLLLTNNDEIQQLNADFRNINAPTNVLSFPQYETFEEFIPDPSNICIGDVAIAYETVKAEAKEFNKPFFDRCTHLFVHGTLHLLGLDHVEADDRIEMEQLETKVLAHFNIADPYTQG